MDFKIIKIYKLKSDYYIKDLKESSATSKYFYVLKIKYLETLENKKPKTEDIIEKLYLNVTNENYHNYFYK